MTLPRSPRDSCCQALVPGFPRPFWGCGAGSERGEEVRTATSDPPDDPLTPPQSRPLLAPSLSVRRDPHLPRGPQARSCPTSPDPTSSCDPRPCPPARKPLGCLHVNQNASIPVPLTPALTSLSGNPDSYCDLHCPSLTLTPVCYDTPSFWLTRIPASGEENPSFPGNLKHSLSLLALTLGLGPGKYPLFFPAP